MKQLKGICIMYYSNMMCGLAYFHDLVVSWINFFNCHQHLAYLSKAYSVWIFDFDHVMAENLAPHKYDVANGIAIRSPFLFRARYSSFNEIQKFVGFPQLHFLFREPSQVRSI